jgi:hypothetical protein
MWGMFFGTYSASNIIKEEFTRSGFKTDFVARTSDIYFHKAEIQNRPGPNQGYIKDKEIHSQ